MQIPVHTETTVDDSVALSDRAMDNLQFIRRTIERSTSFTAVSGLGGIGMAVVALTASLLAPADVAASGWLGVWLGASVVGAGVAWASIAWKARVSEQPLGAGPARKFALAFSPALLAGAVLTAVLVAAELHTLLPGVWLLLYGTGVATAGAYSVRVVPLMGACFMILGSAALLLPQVGPNVALGLGFGGLHLVFGSIIAWRYGG